MLYLKYSLGITADTTSVIEHVHVKFSYRVLGMVHASCAVNSRIHGYSFCALNRPIATTTQWIWVSRPTYSFIALHVSTQKVISCYNTVDTVSCYINTTALRRTRSV